jgi:hypothetical protein
MFSDTRYCESRIDICWMNLILIFDDCCCFCCCCYHTFLRTVHVEWDIKQSNQPSMQSNICAIFMDIYDFATSYILSYKSHIPWNANYVISSQHLLQSKCSGFHVRHFTVCPRAPVDGVDAVRQYSWPPDIYVQFHVSRQQRHRTAWFHIFMNVVI